MYNFYERIKSLNEFDKYPPFPYPDMEEEKKYNWAIDMETNKWVFVGIPD